MAKKSTMTGSKSVGGGASALTSHSKGFTLAEVLITLAIVGVVAALTIPTLIKNYQEKVHITRAKQAYSIMNNAINLYVAQNNCSNLLCLFDTNKTSDEVAAEFAKVVKTAKLCKDKDSNDSYCKYLPIKTNKPSYKEDGKWGSGDNIGRAGRMYLQNGMIFRIAQRSGTCYFESEYIERDENGFPTGNIIKQMVDRCAIVYIDTNNSAEPNQYGVDIFRFDIKSDGSIVEYGNYLKKIMQTNKLDYIPYNIGDEAK